MLPYDEYGSKDKPLVILLHGALAVDSFCMQYSFQSDYHLVVPHLWGSGRSVDKTFSYIGMLSEIAELITVMGGKCILVGHSAGADLAFMLLCSRPELVSRAVLLSPCLLMSEKGEQRYVRLSKLCSAMLKWGWLVQMQGRYWRLDEKQRAQMVEYAAKVTPEQYAAFFTGMPQFADYPQFADVNVPVLAMCGKGEVAEVRKSVHALESANPNCQAMVLKHAGHAFPMRAYKRLNPILKMYLTDASERV